MTNTRKPIYLDYAATTPVDPRVMESMVQCLSLEGPFGNSVSHHVFGQAALQKIEEARSNIANLIHTVPRNLIFTSGATEAINLAIKGVAYYYQQQGKHIVTCQTEHPAVLESCAQLREDGYEITYLKPKPNGLVDLEQLQAALRPDTILVSIMHVNNETGVIQDIAAIGEITRRSKIFFHVDAAQSVGKIPIDLQTLSVDLMSFSAHKLYGPKGIGALYMGDRPKVYLKPLLQGGRQERKLRAGTLPTHQIVGMGEAFRIANLQMQEDKQSIQVLRDKLWAGLQDLPGIVLNGHPTQHIPGILNIRFEGMDRDILLEKMKELSVSVGSACNSITLEPSIGLRALGLTDEEANHSIRFSIGRFTTEEEIMRSIEVIKKSYQPALEVPLIDIQLTPSAVAYLTKTLTGKSDVLGVRLGVKSAGCSGLSYVIDFAKIIHPEDKVFTISGLQVVVDNESFGYLKGMEVDCVMEGLNEFLKFNNPNVKSACGCGESFSVTK